MASTSSMNLYPFLKVLLISLAILIVPYAGATSFGTSVLIANYSILTLSVVFTLKISHRNSKSKNFSFFCLIFSTYLYVVAIFPEDLNPQNFILSNFLNFIDDKMKPNLAYQVFQPFILLILTVENIYNSQSRDTNERNFPSILRFLVTTILLAMPCLLFLSKGYQVPLTAALATSGLITAIVGLALQGNLSNVVSGIFLNLEKPFEKNDWITVDGQLGQVKNISWRTTNLVSIDNMEIAIPNDKLAQATVINLARNDPNFSSGGFVTYDPIVVHPRHNPENIMALLKDALAKAVPADKRSFFGYTDVWFGGAKDGGLEFWIAYDCLDRALLFSQRSSIMMSINHVLTKAGVTMSVGHILQTIKPDASLLAIQDYSQDQRTYDKLYAPAHNIYLESQKPEFWFRRVNLFKALNDEGYDTTTVTISIGDENDAPIASDFSITVDEDVETEFDFNGEGVIDDPDGDNVFEVKFVTEPHNKSKFTARYIHHASMSHTAINTLAWYRLSAYEFKYQSAEHNNQDTSFTYKIRDSNDAESDIKTVSITVNPVNDAPGGSLTITGTQREGYTLQMNNNITEDADGFADGDSISIYLAKWYRENVSDASYDEISDATNLTYTLEHDDIGLKIKASFSYLDAGDMDGNTGTWETVWSEPTDNIARIRAPDIKLSEQPTSMVENTPLDISTTVENPDSLSLTYEITGATWLSWNGTILTLTPGIGDVGTYTITLTVTPDNYSNSTHSYLTTTLSFTITVNMLEAQFNQHKYLY